MVHSPKSAGVVIGRFQIDDLHEGHIDLLQTAQDEHDILFVVIGLSPLKCTSSNPLDFECRRHMIMERFPSARIGYVVDQYSDEVWSENLDSLVQQKCKDCESITLYGGRDSFAKSYSGKFPVKTIESRVLISASKIRANLSIRSKPTRDFRAGAIWAMLNQYPSVKATIDVLVFNPEWTKVLLGKRAKEDAMRFIGGYSSPKESFEETAYRELGEEACIIPHNFIHVCSFFIDDYRYKGEVDKVTTTLYVADQYSGTPSPGDDIDELYWMDFNYDVVPQLVVNHQQMMLYMLNHKEEVRFGRRISTNFVETCKKN